METNQGKSNPTDTAAEMRAAGRGEEMLPADVTDDAGSSRPRSVPSGVTFEYLGDIRGASRDPAAVYGLAMMADRNVWVWKRVNGSWRRIGTAASKAQAVRIIRRRAGVLND